MAAKKSRSKRSGPSPADEAREAGRLAASGHPALRYVRSGTITYPLQLGWVRISADGSIQENKNRSASPEEWAWAFAHAKIHLGLGHHDPAVTGAAERDAAHDAACCVAVNRLLKALKIGRAPFPMPELPAGDERALASLWRREGVPDELATIGTWGTGPDLYGPPRIPKSPWHPSATEAFAQGLTEAITATLEQANRTSSEDAAARRRRPWYRAMGWFTSSYPLLGGIAAGFTIVDDPEVARRYDITVAAVDATLGEIYVNPHAHLSLDEWVFVLAHEMLHAGLRHGARVGGRHPFLWNVACDFVINGWLVEMDVGTMPDGPLLDLELTGLSAEAVYERIATDARRFRRLATLRGTSLGDVLGESLPLPRTAGGGIDLDEFYRRALTTGLAYHQGAGRGWLPAGLVEEIRVLDAPPISWDVALARWFEQYVRSPEPVRSYARASRRQGATPGIPRPGRYWPDEATPGCTFGVVLDTSGSMDRATLGKALGAIAAYAAAKDVPAARVVYCDTAPHDAGYLKVEDIVGRIEVRGRGGTALQPAVRFLERTPDFPSDGPILIITDGECDTLRVARPHAYLVPAGRSLPFPPAGPVFRIDSTDDRS